MRHSDAVGSGKGEDSRNFDINRRDSDDDSATPTEDRTEETTKQEGNPDTVDVSDDPQQ